MQSPTASLSANEKQQLLQTFNVFDHEQNEYVDIARIPTMIRATGETPTESQLSRIVDFALSHGSSITADLFMQMIAAIRYEKDSASPSASHVEAAFRVFDPKNKGFLTKDQFTYALSKYGDKLPMHEVDRLMPVAEVDEQGHVNYRRFSTKVARMKP